MLDRLRRSLRSTDLSDRVHDLEQAQAESVEALRELRERFDRDVHDAVELNQSVVMRRLDALTGALESGLVGAREHTEAAVEVSARKLSRRVDIVRRLVESAPAAATLAGAGAAAAPTPPPTIAPDLYVALEDRFRGEQADIEERQRRYLPYLREVVDDEHPVLDIGSGRGEWLRILAEAQVPARGIDTNAVLVAECREAGLSVDEADLIEHLSAQPDGSIGVVTMFHVVEHLPFPVLVQALQAVSRVLRPGGVLLAETPNALNLRVAATNFWIDPTHQRPLHPDVLGFVALESGFDRVEHLFLNRIGPPPPELGDLPEAAADVLRRLLDQVDGPGDFCLVARTAPEADEEIDAG